MVRRLQQRKQVDRLALDGLAAMKRRRWLAMVDRHEPAAFKKRPPGKWVSRPRAALTDVS